MDALEASERTVSAPVKEHITLNFGENGNDRLRYLVMRGSFPDSRVLVRHEDLIADLMMLQPEDIPFRYRWTRNSFITVDEVLVDLRRRMQLQIKPDYQLVVFDALTVYKQLSGEELTEWMHLMCNVRQSMLIELF